MANARDITRWVGVALIVVGVGLGIYGLVATGYNPFTAAWWSFNFNVFWGGIAGLVVGIAVLLGAQYFMRKPVEAPTLEERKRMEIPA